MITDFDGRAKSHEFSIRELLRLINEIEISVFYLLIKQTDAYWLTASTEKIKKGDS